MQAIKFYNQKTRIRSSEVFARVSLSFSSFQFHLGAHMYQTSYLIVLFSRFSYSLLREYESNAVFCCWITIFIPTRSRTLFVFCFDTRLCVHTESFAFIFCFLFWCTIMAKYVSRSCCSECLLLLLALLCSLGTWRKCDRTFQFDIHWHLQTAIEQQQIYLMMLTFSLSLPVTQGAFAMFCFETRLWLNMSHVLLFLRGARPPVHFDDLELTGTKKRLP